MALIIQGKMLFLHVPKTGGLFVQNFLRGKHIGYRHSHINLVGTIAYSKIFKFCFIREPDEWYRSYWQMKMKFKSPWFYYEPNTLFHPNWEIDPSCGSSDLNEFVKNCAEKKGYLVRMYKQFIESQGARVDFVGRTKTLKEDLATVLDFNQIDYNKKKLQRLPKFNKSEYTQELTEETRRIILEAEREYYNLPYGFITSES